MKFTLGKVYLTEDTPGLNALQEIRNKLNSMEKLSLDTRRDMANRLFLLELSFIEELEGGEHSGRTKAV